MSDFGPIAISPLLDGKTGEADIRSTGRGNRKTTKQKLRPQRLLPTFGRSFIAVAAAATHIVVGRSSTNGRGPA
jgi:hypothetical protein